MRRDGLSAAGLALVLAFSALLGCAGSASPVKPSPPAPPARAISSEQRTVIDREYFTAVSAYKRGDYPEALLIIKRILALDPANADALALRRRIAAAQKAGGP